jgi:hypothetical protein
MVLQASGGEGGDVASHDGTRVSISDPRRYPYAILTRLRGSSTESGYELHFLEGTGVKAHWTDYVERLQRSGDFTEARLCTLGLMDDSSGMLLGD